MLVINSKGNPKTSNYPPFKIKGATSEYMPYGLRTKTKYSKYYSSTLYRISL